MSSKINVIVRGQSQSDAPCTFKNKVMMSNISFPDQMVQEDTIYIIKWNFDLKGASVNIPARVILDFQGGKLMNGSIHWNTTKILNKYQYEILHNITETGDKIIL